MRSAIGRSTVCLAMVLLAAASAGCGGEAPERTLSARVDLDLADSVPVGSPLDIGYTWTPAEDVEAPADDYKVFVHLVDPDGAIILQDDHYPPVPTSQWQPGQPISYRRWLYPTASTRADYFDFYIGLYEEAVGQVATLKDGSFELRPLIHTTIIRSDDQDGLPVYVEGWNERETSLSAEEGLKQWQWMRKTGTMAFGNPRGDAVLHLRAHSPVAEIGGPQTITVRIRDVVVETLEIEESSPFIRRVDIPSSAMAAMADSQWVEMTFEVNEAFIPAEVDPQADDTRELGLQVFYAYLAKDS